MNLNNLKSSKDLELKVFSILASKTDVIKINSMMRFCLLKLIKCLKFRFHIEFPKGKILGISIMFRYSHTLYVSLQSRKIQIFHLTDSSFKLGRYSSCQI